MFLNREDAANQLAARLRSRNLRRPVVLGIPRGGVVLAGVLARALTADLDVLIARKIRAPYQPELAIGSVGEDGGVYLFHPEMADADYLAQEKSHQISEIKRRRKLIDSVAQPAKLTGRSVIVTDDGIATGSTLLAGLGYIRSQQPLEIIVAVPVAPPDTLAHIEGHCDEIVCLSSPDDFAAVGQFYDDFKQVSDAEMLDIFRKFRQNARKKRTENQPRGVTI